ncbi:ABC transporter ATP-binding protein [Candidatus Venteria ishoeyi]|uniref:ABC transporter ATP-binding protein YtrE n=1 Tax=Candidatus Venteria ishoeyi TaxID=1899563 RepID=A0A1H6FGX7_9GAMM|nr:ABC transporter ATP-binding protein [Candidatus Venteria ishoeyi]SEH08609.1 ABC transporter ATP-binding protein YtrE [Candidatus Venteria ishoeyi]
MSGAIQCIDLGKTYYQGNQEIPALKGVQLNIPKGDFVCLSGPSGSGKSTLLNLISGLDQPTTGQVRIGGTRLDQLSKTQLSDLRLHRIGFVFQAYNLVPVLSARENVELIMQLQGVPAKQCRQQANSILAEVGLEGLEQRRPADLSGGQQQRVAVARAIASKPELILADEPTANLDSQTAESLMQLLQSMNEQHGMTFLFSTHDPLVMNYSKRLIRLHDGALV